MPGIEPRVSDLESDMAAAEKRLDTAEARLDYAGKMIGLLAAFGREAGVRIVRLEERATASEHANDLLEDRVKALEDA